MTVYDETHDALCAARRTNGARPCTCQGALRAAAIASEERLRPYAGDGASPSMVTLDLASGFTTRIAACCATPAPMTTPARWDKNTRRHNADLVCGACKQTLAVMRWRT